MWRSFTYSQFVHGKTMAFMHQRMSFFKSSKDRMLVLGFYGWSPEKWMTNWDNYGIGRVVRELFPDGSMSDIFFIRPNYQGGWTDELLNYPLYDKAVDKGFIEACEELLANRLYTQQWAEENGDADDIITIKHPKGGTNQAFCWYHVDDERVVGLWKHSKVAASNDGGRTWSEVRVEPSLIMSGQKIWGQKCVSGVSTFGEASYALIYDPTLESTHRYPLCMISGKDGYHFDDMKLIHGEVPRKRYAGFWKDYGPQYMRGITEGIVTDDEDRKVLGDFIYLVYSVNKEDIWVSKIPYPKCPETDCGEVNGANGLNIYKPRFTDAEFICDAPGVISGVEVSDRDPVDHFVMSKVMKSASKQTISLKIAANPTAEKPVYIELLDEKHIEAVRLIFKPEGRLCIRTVDDIDVCRYEPGKEYELTLSADCRDMYCVISFDDKNFRYRFYRAVNEISLLQIYTGKEYSSPTLTEDPEKQKDISYDTEKMHENASCFKAEEIRIHG